VLLILQSLVRIPDTLLMSMEFLTLYTPSEHNQPLDDLRKVVTPYYPDIMNRSNKTFWQRKVRHSRFQGGVWVCGAPAPRCGSRRRLLASMLVACPHAS
jgi:hypothetical protein